MLENCCGRITAYAEMTSWLTNRPGNGFGAGASRIRDIVFIADNPPATPQNARCSRCFQSIAR